MLTKKDYKLLYELDQGSRQSLSQISRKAQMSEQVISYKLANYQKQGIVSNFFTVIDIAKLGYTCYRVMIQLSNTKKEKFDEIIKYLKNHENVLWLASCGGRFDLVIDLMAKNINHFNKQLNEIRSKFSDNIQNYTILTIVEVFHLGRDYLIDKKRELMQKILFFGKEIESIEIDKYDKRILSELSENARINLLDIAKKLDVSGNTISNRIRMMKKNKLIQGFKPLLHLEKIGIEAYKILIKLHNITIDKEKRLYSFAQQNPCISFIIKTVGEWDLEFEAEVKSREELQKIIMSLRDNFSEMIKEIETIPVYYDYRYNYFPKELLKGETYKEPELKSEFVEKIKQIEEQPSIRVASFAKKYG